MVEDEAVIEQKLGMVKDGVLAKYGERAVAMFAVGSITREATADSDIDVVTVFDDRYFSDSIAEIRAFFAGLSALINKLHPAHELVLWPSKLDHYRTYLPDVSYVRANLPSSLDRLDAWCGLAKHTLIHYEASASLCLHGAPTVLAHEGLLRIPSTEARELYLLATRTFAQGLHELFRRGGLDRQPGVSHIAKAGLRAAYAVLIRRSGEPLNSYRAIHDAAVHDFPERYRALIERLFEAKTTSSAADLPLLAIIDLLKYCEAQVADAPRLTFSGVVPGMGGESFAFSSDSITRSHSPVEEYSRFADARTNYIHLLYFLVTAKEILVRLADIDWDQAYLPILEFFFEEITVIASFALNSRGHLRIVLGRSEREPLDLFLDADALNQLTTLVRMLAAEYADRPELNQYSRPWLSQKQKIARLEVILASVGTIVSPSLGPAKSGAPALRPSLDDYIDALVWAGRSLVGVFSPQTIETQSQIALKLYQAGAVEAARTLLEAVVHAREIKEAATEEARLGGPTVWQNADLSLSKAFQYYAVTLHRLGKIPDAKEQYLTALELDPGNVSALADLALMLMTEKADDETAKLLIDLAEKAGEQKQGAHRQISIRFIEYAIAKKRQREYSEALLWYGRALQIDKENEKLHYNLGLLHEELGQTQDAMDMYRRSMSINPDYVNAYVRLAFLLEKTDIDAGIEVLTTARRRGIADKFALANLGSCYWKQGREDLAEEYYRAALGLAEDHPDALNGMANVLIARFVKAGDIRVLKEAIEYYRKALEAEPEFYGARVNYERAVAMLECSEATQKQHRAGASAGAEMSPVDHLVYKLDELRRRSGSFVCSGEDGADVDALCDAICSSGPMQSIIRELVSGLNYETGDDLIFRSSLVGVRQEPASMQSVFMPRDRKREGLYLPYVVYALGKLEQNFRSEAVQRELREAGCDPARVHLSPLIQKVAGATDGSGARGRERTVSFSAKIDVASGTVDCNVVLGLPLLATRPVWNGSLQAAKFKCLYFEADQHGGPDRRLLVDWVGPRGHQGFRRHDSLGRGYRQTHKAVLIPEQGPVYELLDLLGTDALYPLRVPGTNEEAYLPIPLELCQELLTYFARLAKAFLPLEEGTRGWRYDGVLIRDRSGSWDSPTIVGCNAILMA